MLGLDMAGQISVKELHRRMSGATDFILIDILPSDHFSRVHLPGAVNACVFEVNFLDQVKDVGADPQSEVVLYGASTTSLDVQVACDKLLRSGYEQVVTVYGGLESWRKAGFTLEGEEADLEDPPQTVLKMIPGRRRILTAESIIGWKGRNANSTHHGTVKVLGGELNFADAELTGFVEVDMDSIVNENLAGNELQTVLEEHLRSDDFFYTSRFATAGLQIISGKAVKTPYLTAPNVDIKATLELRGVKADLGFKATVTNTQHGSLAIQANFDIDRTKWNIIYGSTRYFEYLGMHQVFDLISIDLRLLTE